MACLLNLSIVFHIVELLSFNKYKVCFFFSERLWCCIWKYKKQGHLQKNKNKNYSRLLITNHASKKKVEWNTENIESVEKYYWPRILFTTEVFFSVEGDIKTFSGKKKKKNFLRETKAEVSQEDLSYKQILKMSYRKGKIIRNFDFY